MTQKNEAMSAKAKSGGTTSAERRAPSALLFDRALRVTPGGVHSPVRAFRSVGGSPVFFARGAGARLFDVEGHAYIDFCQSFGPLILGHADPDVARAAHEAVDDGWSFGACEPYSLALAEWVVDRLPWVERIRFVSSGTEAVMSALRIARAATGRSRILKFEGCYHGHTDAMLVQAGSGLAGRVAASSAGVPDGILSDTLVAPLDDPEALERVFAEAGRSIAAAIVEPLPANYGLLPQRAEWLARLVALCREHGALVVLDEVISGFRVAREGMAGEIGITPDLVTYGKVLGGGFPVAAYAGRADLMELVAPAGPVYQAGTLSANPVGMRAGLATLSKMERWQEPPGSDVSERTRANPSERSDAATRVASERVGGSAGAKPPGERIDGWRALNARTERFCAGLAQDFADADLPIEVVTHASMFWLRPRSGAPVRRVDQIPASQGRWYQRLFHAALARRIYLPPSGFEVAFLSMAHDVETMDAARAALVGAAREAGRP